MYVIFIIISYYFHNNFFFIHLDWLSQKKKSMNFEELSSDDLAKELRCFYAEARTKNGNQYSKSALVSIRAGINRHLTSPPYSRTINIMKDKEFMSSNHVLIGIVKSLKREGADKTKHHPPISNGDLEKMYSSGVLSITNPTSLVRKVWFEITLHFCRRGREGLRELTPKSFLLHKDDTGREYFTMSYNEADKTHHGVDSRESVKDTRLYALPESDLCPVKSLKLYLSKRNPKNNAFFQRPLTSFEPAYDVWYVNAPMGYHTLGNMMSNISKAAGLSLTYTNHCVRATTATVLAHSGVSSLGIMSVTGHRNEKSIQSYVNAPSVSQRRQYSETLQRVATGVVSQCNLTSPAPPSSASTSSVAVREVSESTMLGGGSLFCGSSFHVAGEGQLHINVYTVPGGEKK